MKVLKQITGPLRENCYFVMSQDGGAVIIDPGDDARALMEKIKALGLKVKGILVTHAHFDHIGGVDILREVLGVFSYFPKGEKDMARDGNSNLSSLYAGKLITAEADILVEHGQRLDFGSGLVFEAILVPGHSPYSICYYMPDNACVFTGDTLFRQSVGRVDLYPGPAGDLVKNIKEKLLVLPEETVVYAGHGMDSTIGKEKQTNPFFGESGLWDY